MINLNYKEIYFILLKMLNSMFQYIDDKDFEKLKENGRNLSLILSFFERYNEQKDKIYISDCKQTFNDELYLELKKDKKSLNFFCKVSNNFNFICEGRAIIKAPINPFLFTLLLKKWIIGKKIEKVQIILKERVFYFHFLDCSLVFEMFGRNGNIFLIDKDNKIIGKLIKKESQIRRENVGDLFIELSEILNQNNKENLVKIPKIEEEFNIREEFSSPILVYKKFLNEIFEKFKNLELKKIEEKIKKGNKLIEKTKKEMKTDEEIEDFRIKGDIILSNLNFLNEEINKESKFNKNEDYVIKLNDADGKLYEIKIDGKLNFIQNANKYYQIYKEEKKKKLEIQKYLESLEQNLIKLKNEEEKLKEDLEKEDVMKLLEKIDLNCYKKLNNISEKNIEKKENKLPFYVFKSSNDEEIYVGKSQSSNIILLKRFSRGEDYWFHARDFQGAYVILKVKDKNKIPSMESFKDAAMLALYFSKGRNAKKGDVIYTKVKYLKNVNKEPGKLIYTNDKNIFIEIDENKIKILKESSF